MLVVTRMLRVLLFCEQLASWMLMFCATTVFAQSFIDMNNPTVTTKYGRVRGISQDIGGGR